MPRDFFKDSDAGLNKQ